jgi:hypothetical protein
MYSVVEGDKHVGRLRKTENPQTFILKKHDGRDHLGIFVNIISYCKIELSRSRQLRSLGQMVMMFCGPQNMRNVLIGLQLLNGQSKP